MQFFTITIATISLVQAAVIPSQADQSTDDLINEVLAEIIPDQEQVPEWFIEFNEYLNDDDFDFDDFDFDEFTSKMSDDEIDIFLDLVTLMLAEEELLVVYKSQQNNRSQHYLNFAPKWRNCLSGTGSGGDPTSDQILNYIIIGHVTSFVQSLKCKNWKKSVLYGGRLM